MVPASALASGAERTAQGPAACSEKFRMRYVQAYRKPAGGANLGCLSLLMPQTRRVPDLDPRNQSFDEDF
jgi:hypothetical protein